MKSPFGSVQISPSTPTRSVLQLAPRTNSWLTPVAVSVTSIRHSTWIRPLFSVDGGLWEVVPDGFFRMSVRKSMNDFWKSVICIVLYSVSWFCKSARDSIVHRPMRTQTTGCATIPRAD